MHAEVRARLGAVDILVNNAGIAVFREPLQATDEDWRKCMSVDLEGVWYCCRAVLPGMLEKQNGAIINIISNHSFSIIRGTFPYPIAKHGLLGLTRSLALEYADRGVAVNAISPGYVDTPIAEWDFSRAPDPSKARRDTEAKQPVGRCRRAHSGHSRTSDRFNGHRRPCKPTFARSPARTGGQPNRGDAENHIQCGPSRANNFHAAAPEHIDRGKPKGCR
ncbi:SDR family NAD(P)-dependent oxidoreductase [Rhizobium sp. 18055]|uniref:SDR family NAD(P)-dependent oxidoreductase n=1 Tax=Rhizobium sp. 18055 TaxID=2681403 RepID=UPI001358D19C|nr:SDR family NAD(P)-dependent oxidoreductase [Rhizobium sp. 18055]